MMNVITLATQTGTGTATAIHIAPLNKYYTPVNSGVVQVVGSGTVTLEGSNDGTNFAAIASGVTAGVKSVALMPYMRANCTAYTSGNVTTSICF
jgi:hypothetical protein